MAMIPAYMTRIAATYRQKNLSLKRSVTPGRPGGKYLIRSFSWRPAYFHLAHPAVSRAFPLYSYYKYLAETRIFKLYFTIPSPAD